MIQPAGSMGLSKIQNFIKEIFNFKIFIQLFQNFTGKRFSIMDIKYILLNLLYKNIVISICSIKQT